jgi:formylglycine-generating enzyme
MKKYRRLIVYTFAITGAYFLLQLIGCKKDNNNNDNNQDNTDIVTIQIPAGTYTGGSPSGELVRWPDETQHQVTLSAFQMSKYEITNAQFADFLNTKNIGSNGQYPAGAYPDQTLIYESIGNYDWGLHYNDTKWIPVAGYENNPVIFVTWYGAIEFATSVGGRLPTEAEWEYASRAATTTPFYTGNCLSDKQANYNWATPYGTCSNSSSTSPGKTQTVGTYTANTFGLCDMCGNVWEWCSDWYGQYPTIAQTNPTGAAPGSSHIFRGGGWSSPADRCRSGNRGFGRTDNTGYKDLGFRVVFGSTFE